MNPTPARRAFRSSFWVVFVTANMVGIATSAMLILGPFVFGSARPPGGWPVHVAALFAGFAGGSIAGALLSAVAVLYFKTYAGPDGLKCTDGYGRYVTVAWPAIHSVRPINLILLKYFRLDGGKRTIWLPLFLTDMHGFADAVTEFAGEDHPLAVALENDLEPDAQ